MVLLRTRYVKENSLYATHAVTDTNASLRQLMKCFGNKIHIVQHQTERSQFIWFELIYRSALLFSNSSVELNH